MALSAITSADAELPVTPTDKLGVRDEGGGERVVLLSCGSFSPVTRMHLEMLGMLHL